jgi:hypothetical protein
MSNFNEVLEQHEKRTLIAQGLQKNLNELQLATLMEIATQLKRIADTMDKKDDSVDCDLPF